MKKKIAQFKRKTLKLSGFPPFELRTQRALRPEKELERFYNIETYDKNKRIARVEVISTAEKKMKEIEDFSVEESFRRRGLGKKLMAKTLNDLYARGAQKVIAAVKPEAIKFYERYGFKYTGRTKLMPSMRVFPIMDLDLVDYFRKLGKKRS